MPALITWWTLDVGELAPEAPNDTVALLGTDLLRRWAEPQRRYHTTTHLVEMFWALEELEDAGMLGAHDCTVARVAAWYHDAVYDPRAAPGLNEQESALLARKSLSALGFADEHVDVVHRLVEETVRHETMADEPVDLAFQDADLWILAAPPERYQAYCQQVREEYAHVPETEFRHGRAAVLEPLVHRETIYGTEHGISRWENDARLNISRELSLLRQ